MTYENKFLVSLVITLLIEVPLVVVMIKYVIKLREASIWKIIFVAFLASLVTLPYFWFVIPPFVDARYYILIGEIIVILFEALIFNQLLRIKIHQAIMISFLVNIISYYLGIFIIRSLIN